MTYAGELTVRNAIYVYLLGTSFKQASLEKIVNETGINYTEASRAANELIEDNAVTKFRLGRKVIYKIK